MSRVYDTGRWDRLRRIKLRSQPTCEECEKHGQIYWAEVVDHKIPIGFGGPELPPLSGLTSLCTIHHNAKTRAEQTGRPFVSQPIVPLNDRGCDEFGVPINPAHHWNR